MLAQLRSTLLRQTATSISTSRRTTNSLTQVRIILLRLSSPLGISFHFVPEVFFEEPERFELLVFFDEEPEDEELLPEALLFDFAPDLLLDFAAELVPGVFSDFGADLVPEDFAEGFVFGLEPDFEPEEPPDFEVDLPPEDLVEGLVFDLEAAFEPEELPDLEVDLPPEDFAEGLLFERFAGFEPALLLAPDLVPDLEPDLAPEELFLFEAPDLPAEEPPLLTSSRGSRPFPELFFEPAISFLLPGI